MKSWLWIILWMLPQPSAAHAQGFSQPDTLTVRLFSTHVLRSATFTSLASSNWMRLCPTCKKTALASPITFKLLPGGIHASSETNTRQRIQLSGYFQVQADDSPQIEKAAGNWDIYTGREGMRVLLTTSVERYVMAALNGEADPHEPIESLKAMAVAARSFALTNTKRHAAEGFNLCDSTHCQSLRFGPQRFEVEQAVRATAGEMLWYGSQRASAFATQHCGGQSEDAASVWPGIRAAYLQTHSDPYCLRRSAGTWHADIDLAQLTAILRDQHWNVPIDIDEIHVVKRTSSGRVRLLQIIGPDKKVFVSASSFRFALDRALGWNNLRSDWYEVAIGNGKAHFEGKGYGHGVGLCQAGAFEMASEGHGYRDILNFYFAGTQVRIASTDTGWSAAPGMGWELITSESARDLLTVGNAAWTQAKSLFPSSTFPHPVVHLMPSTELFRQTTEEPGWMLASTRGDNVYLQPLPILKMQGSESATLLHEFLHVLVETETTQSTPLWLREGLVEVLADGPQHYRSASSPAMAVVALETALAHPADAAKSRRAHVAAAQYAQQSIDHYGVATVRSWLHAGVPATALERAR